MEEMGFSRTCLVRVIYKRMRWEMGVAEAWIDEKKNRGCLVCR